MAATLLRTIRLVQTAVDRLELPVELKDVERLGIMVNKAMSTQARSFHTAEHVFNLARQDQPLQILAALFHDIVYYSIDQGFIPEIEDILINYVYIDEGDIVIREDLNTEQSCIHGVLSVFGFQPGDHLPAFGGMNECLSAIVLVHEMEPFMKRTDLLQVVCSIEATIPFRKPEANGHTPPQRLASRVTELNESRQMGLSEENITSMIQKAVIFANTDVENFAEQEVAAFLDNTWKLLPETNPSLRTTGLYTVKNYRIALQKMEGFMNFLNPSVIFTSYKGVPSSEDLKDLNYHAKRNVLAARDYLGVKLLTTGVLEAIAEISGGDVPIALLMGDISDAQSIDHFESMLPHSEVQKGAAIGSTVYSLLAEGRNSNTQFDLNRSPLAKHIYLHIGSAALKDYLATLKEMFDGVRSPEDFLDALPSNLILPVIKACAEMAFTRRGILSAFVESREGAKGAAG